VSPEIGVPPEVEKVASRARLRRAWMELGEWLVGTGGGGGSR